MTVSCAALCITIMSLVAGYGRCAQQYSSLPVRVAAAAVSNDFDTSATCPAENVMEVKRNEIKREVENIVGLIFPCRRCGDPSWTRVAYLDMADPTQQCPSDWVPYNTPIRGCGRNIASEYSCNATFFSVNGSSYSQVCGRVVAYQKGSSDGFLGGRTSIEGAYVSGLSLTHGSAGSRQHIWTFVVALFQRGSNSHRHICPCTDIGGQIWAGRIPSFVGDNYFCDSGNPGPSWTDSHIHTEDPLWDGAGCLGNNTCCQLHNPPWFCTSLPQPTTDNLEMRICSVDRWGEDAVVTFMEIYVK